VTAPEEIAGLTMNVARRVARALGVTEFVDR
jgi:hypothetical protein